MPPRSSRNKSPPGRRLVGEIQAWLRRSEIRLQAVDEANYLVKLHGQAARSIAIQLLQAEASSPFRRAVLRRALRLIDQIQRDGA